MSHYKDKNNGLHWLDSTEFEHLLPIGSVKITDAEAESIRTAQTQEVLNSRTYIEKRAEEYPSIEDQLDLIYHQGVDAWKFAIQTIKNKYPKT